MVSVSAVLLFGFFMCFLLKRQSMTLGACVVTALFGFFLASTGAAAPIDRLTVHMAGVVAGIGR